MKLCCLLNPYVKCFNCKTIQCKSCYFAPESTPEDKWVEEVKKRLCCKAPNREAIEIGLNEI